MNTDVFCPYCKKRFIADVVVVMNPYTSKDQPAIVSEVGITKYKKIEDEGK